MKEISFALFSGVCTALITPFLKDGKLDEKTFRALIGRQIENGVSALVIAGTTGEGSTLSDAEKCRLVAIAKEEADERILIYGNCGSNDSLHAASLAKKLTRAGADGLLAVTPYYNKATERGLYLHYKAIASATDAPIMVYHVPTRTGCRLTLESYRNLSRLDTIVAVKESSSDLRLLSDLLGELGKRFAIYAGNDDEALFARRLGARGCVSVLSNLLPCECVKLQTLCDEKNWDAAYALEQNLLPKMRALFYEVNPAPVKYVACRMGLSRLAYRLPMCPPSPETRVRLQKVFGV